MLIGKLSTDQIVQVLKFAYDVGFSEDRGWLLIDPEVGELRPGHLLNLRWIPISTRFEWIKSFTFRSTSGS